MKVSKKTAMSVGCSTQDGGRKNHTAARPQAIKLKAVTTAERQQLRIMTYHYILP